MWEVRDIMVELTALCCDTLKEVLCNLLARPLERFDEDDAVVGVRFPRVQALYSDRHLVRLAMQSKQRSPVAVCAGTTCKTQWLMRVATGM